MLFLIALLAALPARAEIRAAADCAPAIAADPGAAREALWLRLVEAHPDHDLAGSARRNLQALN